MAVKKSDSDCTYKRIIVKLGTSLLTAGTNKLDIKQMTNYVAQIAALHDKGLEVVLVTSGAIAAGREKLGLSKKVKGIPYRQMLASVGQSRLMSVYEQLFNKHGITVGQALLTKAVLVDRAGYLNARNTLLALLEMNVVPVINENDVVAVDEIREDRFGDNDNLSAIVANLVDADLLLILTDIDGLFTADPNQDPSAEFISQVDKIDEKIEKLLSGSSSGLGTGGMITKIEAAGLATSSCVTTIIANGREKDIMSRIAGGETIGTKFVPVRNKLDSRGRWLLTGLRTRGKLIVDSGAVLALKKNNKSLLAAGIKKVEGNFKRGDVVDICDMEGSRLGRGIANYTVSEIEAISGSHSKKINELLGYDYGSEVVHRNNLVIL